MNNFLKIRYFRRFLKSLSGIINDQIIEVEAMNLTACNLAQKLVCLEGIEGGKFAIVYASVESATDNRFLQSLKNYTFSSSLVACVVDERAMQASCNEKRETARDLIQ